METDKITNTPETDQKAVPHIGFYSCATVPAEFARKLERERDQAIARRPQAYKGLAVKHAQERDEAMVRCAKLQSIAEIAVNVGIAEKEKAIRERDEAKAGREAYKQLAVKHAQERDEARAELAKRGLSWQNAG